VHQPGHDLAPDDQPPRARIGGGIDQSEPPVAFDTRPSAVDDGAEPCDACYGEHPAPRGASCPVAAWENARRAISELLDIVDAGTLPPTQSDAIRSLSDQLALELERAARVIALKGPAWARAIEPDRPTPLDC
jgi:hypothetical protein